MQSRSPEALAQRKLLKKAREAAKRQQYRAKQENKQTIELTRKHSFTRQTDFTLIKTAGFEEIDPPGNLTLLDQGKVVLQRISPTSHRKALEAKASCKAGKILFEKYCSKKQESQVNGSRQAIEHHLGIWHTQGQSSLNFTAETLHYRYKQEALDLLAWSSKHARSILIPAAQLIETEFQQQLGERPRAMAWLSSLFGSRVVDLLLHPWYSTTAFFVEYSAGFHRDQEDCNPSFLFNFEEPAWIELPEFEARVKVHPLDLLVLNSHDYWHRTVKPVEATGKNRWAFSAFLRRAIFEMRPVSKVAAHRLESLLT